MRRGAYDAGVAPLAEVLLFTDIPTNAGPRLKILKDMRCPSPPWVATKKLDRAVLPSVQASLVSLRDTNVLATVDSSLSAFQKANPADYDALAQQMEKAKQFDLPASDAPGGQPK